MSRSERRALSSNLAVVLLHLLKWNHQPAMRSSSWLGSLREHRKRIQKLLKESPSLKHHLTEIFNECYQEAREDAAYETGLLIETFPIACPFSIEKTLDFNYLPDDL